ncbi:MAG: endonuclease [Planctomycetales bacterium]|nr:endonuclease [Planctomycetales bacterium]
MAKSAVSAYHGVMRYRTPAPTTLPMPAASLSKIIRLAAALACFLLPGGRARADAYDPPANYYNSATGTGATLKSQLHNIIDNHTVRSYDDLRSLLQVTDRDPNNPSRMILVYDRVSLDVSKIGSSIPGWDNGVSWNREHTWPRARGVDSSGPDNSDLHQLRPSTNSVNSDRGNLNFGGAFGQPYGQVFDKGATVWYPGDADAGMIARQEFYMAVRYDGSDGSTEDLELYNGNPSTSQGLGDLARLIEWNYQAIPDQFERYRNQTVYGYQKNRNPFIDHPEFVWSVFVNQNNDSQLALAGGTAGAAGATTLDVDMGRVLVGAPTPGSQVITLNKSGSAGTYYEVTATGAATSSVTGRFNAFATGGSGSRNVTVGLNASTAAAGLITGTVAFDNLDITTGSGSGRGAQDGNDTANLALTVLDHARPSFDALAEVTTLSYDFGALAPGAAATSFQFDLYNLLGNAGYTAGLDLDQIDVLGDSGAFSLDIAPFMGSETLVGGGSRMFNATFDPLATGEFAAVYTFDFSDEDLPGAQDLGSLQLLLTAEVVAADNADFDDDGSVAGADLLAWQRGFGMAEGAARINGDANSDGAVTADDLGVWQTQFGAPSAPSASAANAAAVPEPAAITLAALLLAGAAVLPRRSRTSASQRSRRESHPKPAAKATCPAAPQAIY